jgi:hypothetical protein
MIGETLPLSQHQLISAAECTVIASRVRRLGPHWTRRSMGGFYSLGAASYLDAVRDRAPYLTAAQATYKLLVESFGGLYDRVMAFFRQLLDEEVSLDLERAVPGFHVFVLRGGDRDGDNPAGPFRPAVAVYLSGRQPGGHTVVHDGHCDAKWRRRDGVVAAAMRPAGSIRPRCLVAHARAGATGGAERAGTGWYCTTGWCCTRSALSRPPEQPGSESPCRVTECGWAGAGGLLVEGAANGAFRNSVCLDGVVECTAVQ